MSTTAITTTTAQPVQAKTSVIAALAGRLDCDQTKLVPLLKKTAFATCKTDEEFMAMCMVANTYNLNPILKEVYAFPSKGGAVVPIVGVDGWIKIMNSQPQFDGIEFEETNDACTAIIYRKDRSHPTTATEWLAECVGNTEPWKRWPRRMLRHKAMIQCARIAFGFAGIYDEDEGRRIAEAQEAMIQCARIAFGFAGIYDEDEGRRIAEAQEAEEVANAEPPKTPQKGLRGALGLKDSPTPVPTAETPSEAVLDPSQSELPL